MNCGVDCCLQKTQWTKTSRWHSSTDSKKMLEEESRDIQAWLPEVQCKDSTVWDDLGCVICWCWSTVPSNDHSQHRLLSGLFALQQDLAPPHKAKGMERWVDETINDCTYLSREVPWSEPHIESLGYWQKEGERHQPEKYPRPKNHNQSILGVYYTSTLSQTDYLHTSVQFKQESQQIIKCQRMNKLYTFAIFLT